MLNVIVACTSSKRRTIVSDSLSMVFPCLSLEEGFARWILLLQSNTSNGMPAADLYKGDHWHSVKQVLEDPSRTFEGVRVWICSAGYGLISPNAVVRSYSATFSAGNSDYVGTLMTGEPNPRQRWWNLITQWAGPEPGEPRSVASLAERTPDDPLLVALPPSYLEAISEDLLATRGMLSSHELMTVLVSGTSNLAAQQFSNYTVSLPKKLRQVLGGSDHALYGRAVKYLVTNWGSEKLTTSLVRSRFDSLAASTPEIPSYNREKRTDKEVQDFIRRSLVKGGSTPSASALLNQYRGLGLACEQKRFSQLYKMTRAEDIRG